MTIQSKTKQAKKKKKQREREKETWNDYNWTMNTEHWTCFTLKYFFMKLNERNQTSFVCMKISDQARRITYSKYPSILKRNRLNQRKWLNTVKKQIVNDIFFSLIFFSLTVLVMILSSL